MSRIEVRTPQGWAIVVHEGNICMPEFSGSITPAEARDVANALETAIQSCRQLRDQDAVLVPVRFRARD